MNLAIREPETDETDLITRVVDTRCQKSFELLLSPYAKDSFNLSMRITKDQTLAEDALQEAFFNVWRGLKGFGNRSRFSTWLYRIVSNQALQKLRKRNKDILVLFEDVTGAADKLLDVTEIAASIRNAENERRRALVVYESLDNLGKEYSEAILLSDFEGLSEKLAAERAGMSLSGYKARLHRGRNKLRKELKRRGAL